MQTIVMSRLEAIDFARNLLNAAWADSNDIVDTKNEIVYHVTTPEERKS